MTGKKIPTKELSFDNFQIKSCSHADKEQQVSPGNDRITPDKSNNVRSKSQSMAIEMVNPSEHAVLVKHTVIQNRRSQNSG